VKNNFQEWPRENGSPKGVGYHLEDAGWTFYASFAPRHEGSAKETEGNLNGTEGRTFELRPYGVNFTGPSDEFGAIAETDWEKVPGFSLWFTRDLAVAKGIATLAGKGDA